MTIVPIDAVRKRFQGYGRLVSFKPGQLISDSSYISATVFLIKQGSARLLTSDVKRLRTLYKLGIDDLVGAASLLRGAPAEMVRAADVIQAYAISDQQFGDLLSKDKLFREYFLQTLLPADLAALVTQISSRSAKPYPQTPELFDSFRLRSELSSSPTDAWLDEVLQAGDGLYLASSLSGPNSPDLGSKLSSRNKIKELSNGPFELPPRLIHLSSDLDGIKIDLPGSSDDLIVEPFAAVPEISVFNSSELGEQVVLVSARGQVAEGLACFQMLCGIFKIPFRRDLIEKIFLEKVSLDQKTSLRLYGQIATTLGLYVSLTSVVSKNASRLQTPCLIPWGDGYGLVVRSDQRGIKLASPVDGWVELGPSEIAEVYPDTFELLLFERTISTPEKHFGFSWFLPALTRHRSVLIQVLVASLVIQIFTLANPLLIQVIIDKVISQRSLDTLQVLGIALLVVTVMEGVLGSLKAFLFTETTNRIDQRLGAEVIDHLLRLPLSYFDRRPVGELGSRIAELEKIRKFITGQALSTLLDGVFAIVYILVMLLYSWLLTAVALAVLPIQIGITLFGAPLFRRQYRRTAEANAMTQSHLIEVLTGIQTVKSQNIEMNSRSVWQEKYSQYINQSFQQTITGTTLSQASQVLQKVSQLLVLWVGAGLVLGGEMTLGQLIAFRIISGYVTQPLLRLSTIWQSIQELRVSFERLADVIDTPQESNDRDRSNIPLPNIRGLVEFDAIDFAFKPSQAPVLKSVSLSVPQGTFVGVVGQSGSGKSTLMKLLARLYVPSSGRILIDDYDINKVELYSLRSQIGIVPQDPLLFTGSISDNICVTCPDASAEQVVNAAKLACAHEFIMALPGGYSTPIGERGASLSGGQRQRIAIARTLLAHPSLLVMDEATSALDYETERNLCDNLIDSLRGKTVFFVTHRLSTVCRADKILVMHQGSLAEQGTHDELMNMRGRYYALYRQQEH